MYLVISDRIMPGRNGPGVVAHVRRTEFPRYAQLVMRTGRDGIEETVAGAEVGADGDLAKPIDPNKFRACVAIGKRILSLRLAYEKPTPGSKTWPRTIISPGFSIAGHSATELPENWLATDAKVCR